MFKNIKTFMGESLVSEEEKPKPSNLIFDYFKNKFITPAVIVERKNKIKNVDLDSFFNQYEPLFDKGVGKLVSASNDLIWAYHNAFGVIRGDPGCICWYNEIERLLRLKDDSVISSRSYALNPPVIALNESDNNLITCLREIIPYTFKKKRLEDFNKFDDHDFSLLFIADRHYLKNKDSMHLTLPADRETVDDYLMVLRVVLEHMTNNLDEIISFSIKHGTDFRPRLNDLCKEITFYYNKIAINGAISLWLKNHLKGSKEESPNFVVNLLKKEINADLKPSLHIAKKELSLIKFLENVLFFNPEQ